MLSHLQVSFRKQSSCFFVSFCRLPKNLAHDLQCSLHVRFLWILCLCRWYHLPILYLLCPSVYVMSVSSSISAPVFMTSLCAWPHSVSLYCTTALVLCTSFATFIKSSLHCVFASVRCLNRSTLSTGLYTRWVIVLSLSITCISPIDVSASAFISLQCLFLPML